MDRRPERTGRLSADATSRDVEPPSLRGLKTLAQLDQTTLTATNTKKRKKKRKTKEDRHRSFSLSHGPLPRLGIKHRRKARSSGLSEKGGRTKALARGHAAPHLAGAKRKASGALPAACLTKP